MGGSKEEWPKGVWSGSGSATYLGMFLLILWSLRARSHVEFFPMFPRTFWYTQTVVFDILNV